MRSGSQSAALASLLLEPEREDVAPTPQWSVETDFKSAGTLSKPRPIGRLVRLAFGLGCAYFVFATLYFSGDLVATTSVPTHLGLWFGFAGGFFLMPHVVNIGFGTSWRRRP